MGKATWGTAVLSGAAFAIGSMPAAPVEAANVTLGFQNPGDFLQFFQNNDGSARAVFAPAAGVGIADQPGGLNGGALLAANPGLDATAVLQSNSVNLTSGVTTVSVMFNYSSATNAVRTQLGILAKPNLSFNNENPPGSAFIAPRVNSDGTVNIQTKVSTAALTTINPGSLTGGIQGNHWYQLSITFTETDTALGTFNLSTIVNDLGVNGTSPATPVFSDLNRVVSVSDFAASNSGTVAFAGVRTANGTTPTLTIDNFSLDGTLAAAPEPGTLALLGAGAGSLLLRRRRPPGRPSRFDAELS